MLVRKSLRARKRFSFEAKQWREASADDLTAAAQRLGGFRDLYEDIAADLGGADLLSEGQKQLARRASNVECRCERLRSICCAR